MENQNNLSDVNIVRCSLRLQTEYQYIKFEELPNLATPKTKHWCCINKRVDSVVGWVCWDNGWRQYVFTPKFKCIFSTGCLKDVIHFIEQVMSEHRQKAMSRNDT